jgi:hypothetical protein
MRRAARIRTCARCETAIPKGRKYCREHWDVVRREPKPMLRGPRPWRARWYCDRCCDEVARSRKYCDVCWAAVNNAMRGKKKDHNQGEIVELLEGMGALVLDLSDVGGGCPDLLVNWRRRNFFIEVKNPKTTYGRKGLNPLQLRMQQSGWHVFIARSRDEAQRILLNDCLVLREHPKEQP